MKSKKRWLKRVLIVALTVGFSTCLAWTMFVNFISVPVLQTEKEAIIYLIKVGAFSIFISALLSGGYLYIMFLEKQVEKLSKQQSKQTPN